MNELLARAFRALDRAGTRYCVLRDADALPTLSGGEVDLLVAPDDWPAARAALAGLGFADLDRWGHAPHRFLVAYDPTADTWLKLDVVTAVAYGAPYHTLATGLGPACLATRRRAGPAYAPAPAHAWVTLLLHCVLDKRGFPERHRRTLVRLAAEADPREAADLLAAHAGVSLAWPWVTERLAAGDWDALAERHAAVAAHLAGRDRAGTLARGVRDRLLRRLDRVREILRPRLPSVALLAPDGAGKSTLADGLARTFFFPAYPVYMGLYQAGARRAAWSRVKGLGLLGRLATQWRRYLGARWRQGRGRLVIFDRYTYDAFLPARQPESVLRRARRFLLARACPPPSLAVLLDAPGAVLYARKGEHSPAVLESQRQGYLALRPHVRELTVVDATNDADQVRRDVVALIWRRFAEHGAPHAPRRRASRAGRRHAAAG